MKQRIITVNAKRGSDSAIGKDTPFRTLHAAARYAKTLLADKEPIHVRIRLAEGTHTLYEPIRFAKEDMGHPASRLTISGADASRTVVTSNVSFAGSAFTKVEGMPYYCYKLRPDERLPNGTFPEFRDFYVNGKRAVLAQSSREANIPFPLPYERDRKNEKNMVYKLYLPAWMVEDLDTDCTPLTELWIKVEWQIHCIHIVSVNRRDRREGYIAVKILESEWPLFVTAYCASLLGRPCWLANNLSLLTKPNDFYYDSSEGKIYYYPENEEELKTATASYPLLENLFIFDGVSNVTVESLGMTGTTSNYVTKEGYITGQCGRIKKNDLGFLTHAAIACKNTSSVTVEKCAFFELGADALNFSMRTEGLLVSECVFRHIGATAVRVGRPVGAWDDETNANIDIRIENNLIDGTGLTYTSNVGIFVGLATDVRILHNTILNSCYSAVSVGWSWAIATWPFGENLNLANVEIAYNYIENFMFGMKDGGAIYTLGGNAYKEYTEFLNKIHHNYMVTTASAGRADVGYRVIYHDQGSSHWHDYDNVIIACKENPPSTSFVIGGSVNCLIERLYIADYPYETPKSIHGPDGGAGVYNIVARDIFRDLRSDELPEEAKAIIRSAGCDACRPRVPEKKVYPSAVKLYVDAKNGNDRASGTDKNAPLATLGRAMECVSEVLRTRSGADITVVLRSGTHTVDKTVKMQTKDYNLENFRITLRPERNGSAELKTDARVLLSWEGARNFTVEGLSLQGRNASLGSSLFLFRDSADITVKNCSFHHINATAVSFTGISENLSVDNCIFSHIGGYALLFGENQAWSEQHQNRAISVTGCLFEHIGYVFEGASAIFSAAVNGLSVINNTFRDLSYEAVRVGRPESDGEFTRDTNYNVDRLLVQNNYIEAFSTAGASAAIRAEGGNCNRFRFAPFNIIDGNYIVVGDETGKDSADYAVFWHGASASQFHTRNNIVVPHKRNLTHRALCFFETEPHAYNSWADENTVITADEETVFCDPTAVTATNDLHDKATVFVSPADVSPELKERIRKIGKKGYTPDIK